MELTINGSSAYVETVGRSVDPELESVVFVHGVGQDHTIWALPSRYFAHHDRNVVAVDLPGHGRSEGQPLTSIAAMADWVVELLEAIGVEGAAFVGHSLGSLVALELAGRFPDRTRALVMVGVSVPLAVAEPLMEAAEEGNEDAHDMLTYWSYSPNAQIGGSPTPGLWMVGANLRLLEQTDPEAVHASLRACADYDAGLERAEMVRCPSLYLAGEKDRMTPVRGAKALLERIPDLRVVTFPGAGHPILAERSDQVLDELITIV